MNIVLGVTGGIAAYKAAELVSRLKKRGHDCYVIMTDHAREFITPLTFESLSGNPVACGMFDAKAHWEIEHISLAKRADLFVIVPATANIIGKLSGGIADDMLTTTVMATRAQVILAPAMNTAMYESPAVQHNLKLLRNRGFLMIDPEEGLLACGDVGRGKLASIDRIEEVICFELSKLGEDSGLLRGKKVLVTAGPTVEPLDPVRYLTNRSSGKMGYAFAEAAASMGAEVILISGPTKLRTPYGVEKIEIGTAAELFERCMDHADCDYVVMAAAPADFSPLRVSKEKIKLKEETSEVQNAVYSVDFKVNRDIVGHLGKIKRADQVIVAFAAETGQLGENARKKLIRKNADYILANDVTKEGAGFDVDTNVASLIAKDGRTISFDLMTKKELARQVLKVVAKG